MKKLTILNLLLMFSISLAAKSYAETTNQWGAAVFGTRLSIVLTNNVLPAGSKVLLSCITTNCSTNNVYFVRTESRGMYEVDLLDDSEKRIELNNPANAGDTSDRWGGVAAGKSFECPVPLLFDKTLKPGHYRLVARQEIYLKKNPGRKNLIYGQGKLVSNQLDIEVK